MSNENNDNGNRPRRGSVGNAVFSNLFQRNSSTSPGSAPVIAPAVNMNDAQRRRLSVSTLGVHGASPPSNSAPYHFRRASTSTNSESIDESAVDEDDSSPNGSKGTPTTPFRRMSMGGPPRGFRNGSISAGKTPSTVPRTQGTSSTEPAPSHCTLPYTDPIRAAGMNKVTDTFAPADQSQFNWSEQLRSRAESSISGSRGSFSFGNGFGTSPPRANTMQGQERAKSVAEMPAPPAQSPPPRKPKQPERQKPDAFQERILKGDFYMD